MQYEQITLSTGATLTALCPMPIMGDGRGDKRTSIVICGGGGYSHIAAHEQEPVALRFAGKGFNTFLLNYRIAPNRFPCQLQDAAAAVAYVRENADVYHVDPKRVAILGFSAGGHLAGSLGVMWKRTDLLQPLGLCPEQVRPDAMVLCYPVITSLEYAHRDSFVQLTGETDPEKHRPYALENLVDADTPPTFLWHTWDDGAVPVQNSLLMAEALGRAGVSSELHVFRHGHHGLSLCDATTCKGDPERELAACAKWVDLAETFLRETLEG